MTANVVHPAELERMLQARVDDARAKRASRRAAPPRQSARRKRRGAFAAISASVLALTAAVAWASHGSSFIDLTTNGTVVSHNGAIFTQGGKGSGTGNFDPFLTLQPGGSVSTEAGFNVCTEPVFGFNNNAIACPAATIENTGGDRTHELRASSVPVTDVNGTAYREFVLDSNDAGSDPWMSIQVIRLFLDEQPDLNYNPTTNVFTGNTGPAPSLLWNLDGDGDQTILMNTQGLENGSGVSDISILIPDSLFPADCFYGSTTCNQFIYFGTIAGDPNLIVAGHSGKNWNTTAGFEEWSTELLPVVNVAKTVDISFDRAFPWDVAKEADGEPDHIDLFAGDTATIDWTVTATVGEPTESDASITGNIVITNPTGGAIPAIPAVVSDVDDVLTLGGIEHVAAVTCPSAFPFTVAANNSVTCTYSFDPTTTDDGTNEATVTLALFDKNTPVGTTEYSDTEDVNFADADVTEIDECIEVTDDNATPGNTGDDRLLDDELCADESPGVYQFSTDVGPYDVGECDSDTITNRADMITNDTATTDFATDSVTVNCYELTVAKTVETSLARTWEWDLEKVADVETISLNAGDTASIEWTVKVVSLGSTDSGFHVEGDITITNPAPIAADDVAVSDAISGFAGTITIDCGGGMATVDIAANDSATCSYSADLPNGTARTNTATATVFGVDYDSDPEDIDFTGATVDNIDDCISVSDDFATQDNDLDDFTFDPDPVCLDDLVNDEFAFDPFTTDVGPFTGEDCGSLEITNNANSITVDEEVEDSADDSVDVTCYEPDVTKTATGTFDRTWTWTIEKSGSQTEVTLDANATTSVSYDVTVDATSEDSSFVVSGTITVSNPNPDDTMTVDVTDALDTGDSLSATDIDCGAAGDGDNVVVPAGGSIECTYEFAPSDDSAVLNTATATLNGIGYDGTDAVEWALGDEIDECVDVSDTLEGSLGQVCAGDAPHTFTYSRQIGPYAECGDFTVTNVASFLTNDTSTDDDSSWTVTVHVVNCGEGCTPGFWQGGFGAQLWNELNDPQWASNGGAGTNPFIQTTLFNSFFTPQSSLNGKTMLDIVGTGGGNAWPRKAARDVVAAYLNASFGLSYPFTPAQIAQMWTNAVNAGGNAGFQAIHAQLAPANELGCDIPPSTALSAPMAGGVVPLAGIGFAALAGWLRRRRGR
jgi:hypothetical protein